MESGQRSPNFFAGCATVEKLSHVIWLTLIHRKGVGYLHSNITYECKLLKKQRMEEKARELELLKTGELCVQDAFKTK